MFRLWSVIPATGECNENGSLSGWENTMVPIYSARSHPSSATSLATRFPGSACSFPVNNQSTDLPGSWLRAKRKAVPGSCLPVHDIALLIYSFGAPWPVGSHSTSSQTPTDCEKHAFGLVPQTGAHHLDLRHC